MKDYKNYHNYNPLDRKLRDGKKVFDISKGGLNSHDVVIDKTIETRILIEQTYNPYSEKKEERIMKCDLDVDIQAGSIVYVPETKHNYIVMTDIDDNKIYKFFKSVKMNYELKWVNGEGDLNIENCFLHEKDIFNVGVKEILYIPTLSEQMFITLQQNKATDTIQRGTKFIVDGYGWVVTNINRVTGRLMKIVVKEVLKDSVNDDMDEEIANASSIKNYSLEILNGENLSVSVKQDYKLQPQVKKGEKIISTQDFTYVSSDTDVATVSDNGTIVGVKKGSVIIHISYKAITTSIAVVIDDKPVYNHQVLIKGSDSVRNGNTQQYTSVYMNNGEIVSDSGKWWITDTNNKQTSLATIVNTENNICTIQVNKKGEMGTFRLHTESNTELIKTHKDIVVKSILSR